MPQSDQPSNESNPQNQRILDARLEYEQLLTTVRSVEQMWWVNVGAFFAVNTLLATVFGLSVSSTSTTLHPLGLKTIHLLIPLTGAFFSIIAIRVAVALTKNGLTAAKRGVELEGVLFARMFGPIHSNYDRTPWGTICASILFLVMWLVASVAALIH